MKLSIVIVSWNTSELLAQCLASIEAELSLSGSINHQTCECFVVDNGSTDGSVAMIRRHFPWVRVIANRSNVGFARANNQALAQIRAEYVLLLNPDTRLCSGVLEAMVRFLEEHPDVGAVGPQLLNPDLTLQPSCYPAPTLTRELWRLLHLDTLIPYGIYPMDRWSRTKPREVEVVQGACLMVRRSIFGQIGLLDEEYFMYTEEVDLCTRIRKAGWRLVWLPEVSVIHYGGQSTQQVAAKMFLQLYASKVIYFRKHHGAASAYVYKLLLFVASLPRILAGSIAWLEAPTRRQRHLHLAGNYWRLILSLADL